MMPNTKIKTNYYMSKILYESRPKLIKFLSDLRTQYRQLQRHFKMKYRQKRRENEKKQNIHYYKYIYVYKSLPIPLLVFILCL